MEEILHHLDLNPFASSLRSLCWESDSPVTCFKQEVSVDEGAILPEVSQRKALFRPKPLNPGLEDLKVVQDFLYQQRKGFGPSFFS